MTGLKARVGLVTLLAAAFAPRAPAEILHVDAANSGGPWDGSPEHPFTNIVDAAAALAATNAVTKGGHEIRVAPGTYRGRVDFTTNHAGVAAAPNGLTAPGRAVVTAPYRALNLNNADYFVIDGFDFTGTFASDAGDIYGGAIYLEGTPASNRVQNCTFYDNRRNGIGISASKMTRLKAYIENCTFYGNLYAGIASYAWNDIHVRNCVFVGNNRFGIRQRHSTTVYYLKNNLFYGNGIANFGGDGEMNFNCLTADEINARANCVANLVANPGWSDLANGWNFNRVYAGSPLLGNGMGGVDIGTFQSPAQDPLSDAVYHVDAALGDDGRSAGEAENPLTPWATLAKAAAEAVAGDTVVVAAGTYAGAVDLTHSGAEGKPILFQADGEVVVTGGAYGLKLDRVAGVTLDGFTVSGASTAGVLLSQSVLCNLVGVTVRENPGAGIYMMSRSCRNGVTGARVYGNKGHGIRLNNAGSTVIRDTRVYQNTGTSAGVHLTSSGHVWLWNCEVYGNAREGVWQTGYVDDYSGSGQFLTDVRLRHCTVFTNGTTGVQIDYWSRGSAENTVMAGHRLYGMYWRQLGLSSATATNCAFHGNGTNLYRDISFDPKVIDSEADLNALSGWANMIVAAPGFRDAAAFDLRLRPGSALIDKGTPTAAIDLDLYGNLRLSGAAVDIGAFERPRYSGTMLLVR